LYAPCSLHLGYKGLRLLYSLCYGMVSYPYLPFSFSLLFASGSLLIPSCNHPFKCNLDPEKNTLNAALRLPRAHATNCTVNIYPPLSPSTYAYLQVHLSGFHLQPVHKPKHNSNKTHTHTRNLLPSIRTPLRTRWIGRTPRSRPRRCRSRSRSCPAGLQCLSHTR
jgi:hypothetical protein